MFAKFSKKIFVTDKLLVSHAQRYFTKHKNKIEGISFGMIDHDNSQVSENEVKAKKFINTFKTNKKKIVLFCVGTPDSEKSLHFDYLTNLIDNVSDYEILAVVAGSFNNSLRCNKLISEYDKHSNIITFTSFTKFSDDFIKNYVDFYFRAYDDFSVPFTVYEAASFEKPILVLEGYGFILEMLSIYNLGVTFSFDNNVNSSISRLLEINSENYDKFLQHHSWDSLGSALRESI